MLREFHLMHNLTIKAFIKMYSRVLWSYCKPNDMQSEHKYKLTSFAPYYPIGILWCIWGAVVECEPKFFLMSSQIRSSLDRILFRLLIREDRIFDDVTHWISNVIKIFGSHSTTSSQNPNKVITPNSNI